MHDGGDRRGARQRDLAIEEVAVEIIEPELRNMVRRVIAPSRRRFLRGAGLGAATVAVGGSRPLRWRLWAPALAQESGDPEIAAFAESVELAVVEAYRGAAASAKVTTPAVADAARAFAEHHEEHGAAFGAVAGGVATGRANPGLLEEVTDQLEGAADENDVVEIAFGLENAAAATHLFVLGVLESAEARQVAASILPVEAQHAVVLGGVLGRPPTELFPSFENQDRALDPETLPVA
jgi:Ferritin-like domain